MKKFLMAAAWVVIIAVVLMLTCGWDFVRRHYGEIFSPNINQSCVAFVGDSIYVIPNGIMPRYEARREITLYDTLIRRKIPLPIAAVDWKNSRIAVSSAQKIYYLNGRDGQLHELDLLTMVDVPLTSSAHSCLSPACSRDGRYVLFEANMTNGAGYRDIYCLDLKKMTNEPKQLTNSTTWCGSPSFLAGGQYIVYDCGHAGCFDLWIMNKNGDNPRRLLAGGPNGNFQRPACSPNSDWIAYQLAKGKLIGISAAKLNGRREVVRTVEVTVDANECLNPSWSPDGKRIIFQKKRTVVSDFAVYDVYDVYEVIFNPDLPQVAVPLVIRPIQTNLYPVWLPLLSDSARYKVSKIFVDDFRRLSPAAQKNSN